MSADFEKAVRSSFHDLGWSEDFVQNLIANDPAVLGLGDLKLQERERRQPSGGRLDLLLQSIDDKTRYAVEVQVTPTDPSHIIRTIEYWDVERRRFPQYDYNAVIVASEVTSRYFNVISLFNQYIPIIAVKVEPLTIAERHSLVFTKILDFSPLGQEEEPAEVQGAASSDLETKTSKETMESIEAVVTAAQNVSPQIQPKYNKGYVQLKIGASFFKLLTLWPKKTTLHMELPIPQSADTEEKLDQAKISYVDYDERRHRYILILRPQDATKNITLLQDLIGIVYEKATTDDDK